MKHAERYELAFDILTRLGEDTRNMDTSPKGMFWIIERALQHFGAETVEVWVNEALISYGNVMIADGSRLRTPGGIFVIRVFAAYQPLMEFRKTIEPASKRKLTIRKLQKLMAKIQNQTPPPDVKQPMTFRELRLRLKAGEQ